jgi:PHP family Zn ribbon phosphoesterase
MEKSWLIKDLDFDKVLFADLHIHSRFSRACSKDLNVVNLVKWARVKGLNLLGTGDFTHEVWLKELKETLKEDSGLFWYEDSEGKFPFILTSEISLVYSQNGKGRRVHLVYLAPSFESVEKINSWLDTKAEDYDGRPISKFLVKILLQK